MLVIERMFVQRAATCTTKDDNEPGYINLPSWLSSALLGNKIGGTHMIPVGG